MIKVRSVVCWNLQLELKKKFIGNAWINLGDKDLMDGQGFIGF